MVEQLESMEEKGQVMIRIKSTSSKSASSLNIPKINTQLPLNSMGSLSVHSIVSSPSMSASTYNQYLPTNVQYQSQKHVFDLH